MFMSLTLKTFNIMNMFRSSFKLTFDTSRDINFSLWWFGLERTKNLGRRVLSLLRFNFQDDEELELKLAEHVYF
jgi:hypothetical protein